MKTKQLYILVNIGCIECGVSSNIVGVFDDEDLVNELAEKCNEMFYWRESGQNDFIVFKMPELNTIADEYLEKL